MKHEFYINSHHQKIEHMHFDSVDEVFITPSTAISSNRRRHNSYQREDQGWRMNNGWYGISGGAQDVIKVVRRGWTEGLERIHQKIESLRPPRIRAVRKRKRRGPAGDEIDVQRIYSGDLDHAWSTTVREESLTKRRRGGSTVTIVIHNGISATKHSDVLFWRGAAAVVLSEMLQSMGLNTRIIAANTSRCNNKRNYTNVQASITLKEPDKRVDMAFIANVALAGFFRVHGFCAYLHSKEEMPDNLGYPRQVDLESPIFQHSINSKVILVPELMSEYGAREFLKQQHEAFTIQAKGRAA